MNLMNTLITVTALACTMAASVSAAELAAPTGEVLLTVSGDVAVTNADETAQFDMEMLRALDQTTFVTTTPWTEGEQTFTGVSLKALMEALELTDGTLAATAINDYAVDVPVSDAVDGGPIIAYEMNGEEMSVRDKGPLWIVYPYDSSEEYRSELTYSRSIWQLDRIVVSE